MYVAYIRAVFDYAAPVWYPLMSKANFNKIQGLQNKALRIILGVPRSTRIHDLHLEANVTPLVARYEAATAFQAEKYRRFPCDDPLYRLAHADPPTRLKKKTWQHYSDEILKRVGIDPSREPISDLDPSNLIISNSSGTTPNLMNPTSSNPSESVALSNSFTTDPDLHFVSSPGY